MKNEKCIKNASKVHQKYMMFHVDFGNLVTLLLFFLIFSGLERVSQSWRCIVLKSGESSQEVQPEESSPTPVQTFYEDDDDSLREGMQFMFNMLKDWSEPARDKKKAPVFKLQVDTHVLDFTWD